MKNERKLGPVQKTVVGAQFLFVAFGATVLVPLLVGMDPSVALIAGIFGILFSVLGKMSALLKTIPNAVLGGIMLLLFGTIASVGISTLIKHKVDMGDTRNLVIVSLILTTGIGGAELVFGSFTIGGIGLAALIGVILNLVIPKSKA